ncbi:MAG: hypothetical protein WKF78_03415 [Candidatus Limnocylindrales bacterium]
MPIAPTTARSSSASPAGPPTAGWPRIDPEQQRVGERVEADEYSKDDVQRLRALEGGEAGRAGLGERRSDRVVRVGTSSARP